MTDFSHMSDEDLLKALGQGGAPAPKEATAAASAPKGDGPFAHLSDEELLKSLGQGSKPAADPYKVLPGGKKTAQYDPLGNLTGYETDTAPTTMPYGEQMANIGHQADNVMRQVANGATFHLADKIAARMNSFGNDKGYTQNLLDERQRTAQAHADQPGLGTAAEMAGGMLTGLGLANKGVSLLGQFGPRFGMIGNMGLGAGEGALYGAAGGAGKTDTGNVSDYLGNATKEGILGLAMGGVAPPLVAGAGKVVNTVLPVAENAMTAMPDAARRLLSKAMGWDGNTAAKLTELGPLATLGDTGPALTGLMQGVASRPGEGASKLVQVLEQRNAGRNGRLASDTDAALGPMVQNEMQAKQALLDARSGPDGVHSALPEIYKNAPPIDPSGVVAAIDKMLVNAKGPEQAALQQARAMLTKSPGSVFVPNSPQVAATAAPVRADLLQQAPVAPGFGGILNSVPKGASPGGGMAPARAVPDWLLAANGSNKVGMPTNLETNAQALNNVKTTLSGLVKQGNTALGIEKGALAKKDGSTNNVIAQLDDLLRTQVPGYAGVMDQSSLLARRVGAVDTGYGALTGGQSAIKPEQITEALAASAPNAAMPGALAGDVRTGMRAAVDNAVGTQANDLAVLRRMLGGDADWNRAKLASTFGDQNVSKLVGAIDRESTFAKSYNDAVRGSQTAQRQQANTLIDGQELKLPPTSLKGIAAAALGKANDMYTGMARQSVRDSLGKSMSLSGPELDQFLIQLRAAQAARELQSMGTGASVSGLLGGM
ncbi:hypothetical protein UFOVP62_17 [uncultured Caudovirales phage]|uniref:Uncharacterized protein n=1 Tax=uncultured Caudovirales phage TaxID=2100421 RepID=A0A6J5KUM6_9CAUD|nr:hypothetical protein UFOVP62_17 [uncultured Caudovirales phage]